jgi:hypothetical protein
LLLLPLLRLLALRPQLLQLQLKHTSQRRAQVLHPARRA